MKSVTFGGFDKQDVIAYIERTAREAAETEKQLRAENETLQQQLKELRTQAEQLRKELEQESAARRELEGLKPQEEELRQLRSQVERLRPDAEAYAQFRQRIGAIECEAHQRAANLEETTLTQLRQTVNQFRGQYQELMSSFEKTSAYVTGELRKMEVNFAQLPRAMDQSGADLNQLAAMLEKAE